MKTAEFKCLLVKSFSFIQTSSPSAVISGFEPITQTNKWCYIFWQNWSTHSVHSVAWLVMLPTSH